MEAQGLVDITTVIPDIHVSLMYARADNFVGRVMYRDLHRAYLLPETAAALKKAQTALQKAHPELSLKVYDATALCQCNSKCGISWQGRLSPSM